MLGPPVLPSSPLQLPPKMSRLFSRRPDLDQDEDDDVTGKSAFHITKSKAETVNGIPVSGEDYVLLVR